MDRSAKINRAVLTIWHLFVFVLISAYVLEIFKGQRTVAYVAVFVLLLVVPMLICTVWYHKDNDSPKLRYGIIYGYLIGYVFVLLTSKSQMAFVYVFPLLSSIILFHDANLVAQLGISAIVANMIDALMEIMSGNVAEGNSRDIEIQIVCLVTCFIGCYLASKLYDELNRKSVASYKQMQQVSLQTIGVIANTVDAKDSNTEGHSRRVAAYSYALAKKLGMSEEEAQNIRTIGLLHDIGKIGIPDAVLHKPGKLTEDEYRIMKMHPTIGANILKDITVIDGLSVGAHYHHERMDGKGYPEGLKGEQIPFIARIICVADCFDAMHSNRVYRSRFSMDYILNELKTKAGTQFDPKVAAAMVSLIESHELEGIEEFETTKKLDDMSDDKDSVFSGSGVYLLDEITTKNANQKNSLGQISTEDWAKTFQRHIEEQLLHEDGRLFVIDVDNMNQINSEFGYAKGDQVLQAIHQVLTKKENILASMRSGGDEFICWMETPLSNQEYEERLKGLLDDIKGAILQETNCADVSLSIGATSSLVSGRDYVTMREDAYKSLYFVKKNGKNSIDVYSSGRVTANIPEAAVEHDLNAIANIIANENDYQGAYHTDYAGFEKIYNLLRNLSNRYLDNVQLILFTMEFDDRSENVASRDTAMNILESAIVSTLRKTDVTARYSTTQQLLLLMNLNDENMKMITDRIMREFYRMYDKGNVTLLISSKNVSMAKMMYNPNYKRS